METQKKILVVDDEAANLQILKHILQQHYQLFFAKDGKKAIEIATLQAPDLVLLDIMMPDMTGYDVLEVLKQNAETAHIPVIFVTAVSEVEDEARGLELGAVDYITKPVSAAIVVARVKTQLSLLKARQELQEKNQKLHNEMVAREDMERIMRHDLKSPLNSVIGFISLVLSKGHANERGAEMLEKAKVSSNRILEMVNQSLDMAKMELGNYSVNAVDINCHEIINAVCEDKKFLAERKKVAISQQGFEKAIQIYVEEPLAHNMFSNLLGNAIEAAPQETEILITVEVNDDVSISIQNQGSVPEEIREHFFDKFVTSGKIGGTGLGTYSARLIANTLGGDVLLDASMPDATKITVSLPGKALV